MTLAYTVICGTPARPPRGRFLLAQSPYGRVASAVAR